MKNREKTQRSVAIIIVFGVICLGTFLYISAIYSPPVKAEYDFEEWVITKGVVISKPLLTNNYRILIRSNSSYEIFQEITLRNSRNNDLKYLQRGDIIYWKWHIKEYKETAFPTVKARMKLLEIQVFFQNQTSLKVGSL